MGPADPSRGGGGGLVVERLPKLHEQAAHRHVVLRLRLEAANEIAHLHAVDDDTQGDVLVGRVALDAGDIREEEPILIAA